MIDSSIVTYPKVTAILRGYDYDQVRCVVKNMVGTRLGAVEVAMNTPGAPQIIQKVAEEFGDDILVGAGTVISAERAKAAVRVGAKFALSPICFTEEIFRICKDGGLMTVPSAFTPSEVWNMFQMGADIVKVFLLEPLAPNTSRISKHPLIPCHLWWWGGQCGQLPGVF